MFCTKKKPCKYKRDILKKLESKCNSNSTAFRKILNSIPSACNPTCVNSDYKEVCTKIKEMYNIPYVKNISMLILKLCRIIY